MSDSHVFDHTHAKSLDSEERKTWQNVDDVLDFVELKPEYVAADLGCGSGYFTVPLANRVKTVYGIDIQQNAKNTLNKDSNPKNWKHPSDAFTLIIYPS
jgi:2-polyprenyl-3-methyl-5-hydroxy-6-metoxy-1,4-benzoquinol methylase